MHLYSLFLWFATIPPLKSQKENSFGKVVNTYRENKSIALTPDLKYRTKQQLHWIQSKFSAPAAFIGPKPPPIRCPVGKSAFEMKKTAALKALADPETKSESVRQEKELLNILGRNNFITLRWINLTQTGTITKGPKNQQNGGFARLFT